MANKLVAYRGNKNLKRSNVQIEYNEDQIREYIKCAQDPIYFIETYVKVVHIDRGLIPMLLYPYQRKVVETATSNRKMICKFPRQSGKSTCISAFALHQIIFNENYNVLIAANKGKTAQEIMKKVQTAYEYLPKWLQQGVLEFNKSTIELENGSRCISTATSSDSARGFSFNCVILDEFAFLAKNVADEFFTSVYPTISSGQTSKLIIISTPRGLNHFYKMYTEAVDGKSDFVPLEIKWNEVPGRDEKFKADQLRNISLEKWQVEFESEFHGSTNTLIAVSAIKNMVAKNPIKKMNGISIFHDPIPGRSYFITLDPSEGKGLDYHAMVVVDITERPFKVVATWRDNLMEPLLVPDVLYYAGKMYNEAFILIETKSTGTQISDELYYSKEYWNLLGAKSAGRSGQVLTNYSKDAKGLATSKTTKSVGCSNFKMIVEHDQIHINDSDIIEEITNFVLKGHSFEADDGFNDDFVMCLIFFSWATSQMFFKNLSDVNIMAMLKDKQNEIKESFLPMFMSDGFMGSEKSFEDEDMSWL